MVSCKELSCYDDGCWSLCMMMTDWCQVIPDSSTVVVLVVVLMVEGSGEERRMEEDMMTLE